jgi:hypothetical protein
LATLIEKELPYAGILCAGFADEAKHCHRHRRNERTPHRTVLAKQDSD